MAPYPTILPQAQSASAHTVTPPTPARLPEPVKPEPHSLPVPKSYPANSGVTQITLSPQTAETRDVKMTTTPRSADELSPSQPNEQSVGKDNQRTNPQFSIKALVTRFKTALSLGTKVKPTCSSGEIQNPFEHNRKPYYLQKFLFTSHCVRDDAEC